MSRSADGGELIVRAVNPMRAAGVVAATTRAASGTGTADTMESVSGMPALPAAVMGAAKLNPMFGSATTPGAAAGGTGSASAAAPGPSRSADPPRVSLDLGGLLRGERALSVLACTWNCGNARPPRDLAPWLPAGGGGHDIIVVGLQECTYTGKEKERAASMHGMTPKQKSSTGKRKGKGQDGQRAAVDVVDMAVERVSEEAEGDAEADAEEDEDEDCDDRWEHDNGLSHGAGPDAQDAPSSGTVSAPAMSRGDVGGQPAGGTGAGTGHLDAGLRALGVQDIISEEGLSATSGDTAAGDVAPGSPVLVGAGGAGALPARPQPDAIPARRVHPPVERGRRGDGEEDADDSDDEAEKVGSLLQQYTAAAPPGALGKGKGMIRDRSQRGTFLSIRSLPAATGGAGASAPGRGTATSTAASASAPAVAVPAARGGDAVSRAVMGTANAAMAGGKVVVGAAAAGSKKVAGAAAAGGRMVASAAVTSGVAMLDTLTAVADGQALQQLQKWAKMQPAVYSSCRFFEAVKVRASPFSWCRQRATRAQPRTSTHC
jgi:hypothetical protein